MDKTIPNSFQCPNFYVDRLAHFLTPEENVVLMKAVREILGWSRKIKSRRGRIAQSIFITGKFKRRGPDGERLPKTEENRLCYGCGLKKSAVRKALDNLDEYRILIKVGPPTQDGQMYTLQINPAEIDWQKLVERKAQQETRIKDQTLKARQAASKNDKGAVPQPSPPSVSQTPPPSVAQPSPPSVAQPSPLSVAQPQRNPMGYPDKTQGEGEAPGPPPLRAQDSLKPTALPPHPLPSLVKQAQSVYIKATGLKLNKIQAAAIAKLASQPDFNLTRWREACESCLLSNVNPGNILCMIDVYGAGGNYQQLQAQRRSGNDPAGQPKAAPPGMDEEKWAAYQQLEAQRQQDEAITADRLSQIDLSQVTAVGIDVHAKIKQTGAALRSVDSRKES